MPGAILRSSRYWSKLAYEAGVRAWRETLEAAGWTVTPTSDQTVNLKAPKLIAQTSDYTEEPARSWVVISMTRDPIAGRIRDLDYIINHDDGIYRRRRGVGEVPEVVGYSPEPPLMQRRGTLCIKSWDEEPEGEMA